ncbi:MAG: formylglycine-generating enzyme family protein [Verrucomicrobia bacterium]|nr:formylglycine-generating enzyme family protein [Verrucomicrobiota bacterium]
MKRRSILVGQVISVLFLTAWAIAPRATAQPQPSLGLRFSSGQPTLSLTGTLGTVYSIQYATNLSPTSHWTDRTLLQAQGGSNVWSDPSASSTEQRFYRAVSVPAPADTNLVFIQPGTFTMGSPTNEAERVSDEVQHLVTISRGFWMGKYLVTQGDYLSLMATNPSYFTSANGYSDDLTRPVETVSWLDATNYCTLRTQQERAGGLIPTNYAYRLPTESEWEYAARAGTTTAFYLGSGLYSGQANLDGQYEYEASVGTIDIPGGIYLQQTTPVGSYAANGWGLYDMIGNVWEWCQDWRGAYPAGTAADPQGPAAGVNRVVRGGAWYNRARFCRSAYRGADAPGSGDNYNGFRVVLAPGQP